MAHWLYRIVPARPAMVTDPSEEESALVAAHFAHLIALRDAGILILAGRTQEEGDSAGLVIFEADDEATARRIAQSDPAVAAGTFAMTLHPYAVAVARGDLLG